MTKIKLTKIRQVKNFEEPYIIAELGSNHNGDMKLAKQLIKAAKKAGADCVKFQSWSKETVFSRKVYEDNYFLKDDYRQRSDYDLEDIVDKFSISEKELHDMKEYADNIGIDCISTPFSKKEVDFLIDVLDVPFIKVASMDLNNYPFLEYIGKKKKPVVLSTGLSDLHEIDKAVATIENTGNKKLIILHCVSIYPPDDNLVHLNKIETLQTIYPYPVGFSDHTLGFSIPLAAIVKGACVIEKHFTLDKDMFGWDHKVSATPEELKIICSESKRIQKALGENRIKSEEDQERKEAFRRSIITTRAMKKGEIVSEKDIDYKRPGNGIAPGEVKYVIGRTLRKDIQNDQILDWECFV